MKLTKLQALQLCEKLWRWLANHLAKSKGSWPEWIHKYGIYYEDPIYDGKTIINQCFACQYHKDRHRSWPGYMTTGCVKNCILKKLWPKGCLSYEFITPYSQWEDGKNKKKNALLIANFCKKEIKRLNRNRIKRV